MSAPAAGLQLELRRFSSRWSCSTRAGNGRPRRKNHWGCLEGSETRCVAVRGSERRVLRILLKRESEWLSGLQPSTTIDRKCEISGAGRADERPGGRDAFENWGCDFFPNHARIKSRPGADDLVPNPEPDLAVLRNQFKREIFSLTPGKAAIVVML